ncbi:GNAT family N-acetyltransferase [Kibdelosporangium aridum]|uniref:GNAT family N-acetyltransferase n=1 Tax=Kibdelosporangium aridum TaxID=2030 RepID=UPI001C8CC943|nr:GNAT family N-acetyltransferase [Kibdelosporangium aridum]
MDPKAVRIVHLPGATFEALARGDLSAANSVSPIELTDYFAGPDWRGVWQMRHAQVQEDPAAADWVTGAIWDEQRALAVGRAGYHGPPDAAGMVEIGYAVDPAYRRQGYARAALEALLLRAACEPQVRTVRVSISPDNVASYRLASQYGFVAVGDQWDEEDGLEIIYEGSARRAHNLPWIRQYAGDAGSVRHPLRIAFCRRASGVGPATVRRDCRQRVDAGRRRRRPPEISSRGQDRRSRLVGPRSPEAVAEREAARQVLVLGRPPGPRRRCGCGKTGESTENEANLSGAMELSVCLGRLGPKVGLGVPWRYGVVGVRWPAEPGIGLGVALALLGYRCTWAGWA